MKTMLASDTRESSISEKRASEAALRGDWPAAERYWRECIAAFAAQTKPDWFRGQGSALYRLERHAEADKIFAAMRRRWPRNAAGWTEAARNAAARKEWPLAVRLWRDCIAAIGERSRANWWGELAAALMQQTLYAEADDVSHTAQTRFPAASTGWEIAAKLAAARGAWARCGEAWNAAAVRAAPEQAFSFLQYGIGAFIKCDREDEAARLHAKQVPSTPAAKRTWFYTGFDLLTAQGDVRGALAFWDAHAEPFEIAPAATPTAMAEAAYDAGFEPSQAIASLAKWIPRDEAVRAVDGVYVPAKAIATRVDRRVRPVLRLRALRLARRWPDYYQELSGLVDSYWVPSGLSCLHAIAACPDLAVRATFLARLRNRLEDISPALSEPQAETYLALLYRERLPEKLAAAYRLLRDRLTAPAAEFFRRAIAGAGERRRPSILGLGLSKTGTTSQHQYLEQLGLLSAHWSNPLTGHFLDEDDMNLFDAVNDVPVMLLAMRDGVDPERRIIVTTRDFASWEQSIMAHYTQYFERGAPSYDRYREEFYRGEQFGFGKQWFEINHELYFRHGSLREAYDCHRDWIAGLEKHRTAPMLHLPLEAGDKAERISRYLGAEFPTLQYPHVNARKKNVDNAASA